MSFNDSGFGESREYGRDRRYGGGRRFDEGQRFEDNRPKPVETGKEYDVSITEISRKGDGIARVECNICQRRASRLKRKNKKYTGRRTLCYCRCRRRNHQPATE
ncbi:protein of unknown function [Nitrosotalea devaniterrae]|uniref:TRAM domain-containing protein n=1 Tax=Nitrosotalea devaniterrae TaxID=1078905 RepID=A0A128A0D6_9ARCH|nr:protein of unknown function [Candidatus Nitrosotalea devanaterra]